ncbi:hypothetical protein EDI_127790 [Entamoeba dispar SAW760]|uniref:TLDc domain-containing protein n=1 Tax=Entamoeba dispar (strain ATCC PRA-260 / SAW760) TaxID=370354 RepID=B0EK67_ENTDS|nr:uncharacterized protein EDI_127790 [Entamoeba dispar SAW760]EDR25075.1 hypothetical protein EDI_127790 [Entamoeba dispar SAW760]|eukprot:EDR25075.1 hypothetical protein EDI_127790 [Entamoeba dispar SAW760]
MSSLLNFFKQPNDIAIFLNQPFLQYENIFEDFTIHKSVIEKITEMDILSIPDPTPTQLLAIIPVPEIIYYHIVTAISTFPLLNEILLTIVPQQMNEMVFWYKYFSFLFKSENQNSLLEDLAQERNGIYLTLTSETTKEIYLSYIKNCFIGQRGMLLMKYIQIINQTTNGMLDKTFYKFSERLEGLPKNQSEIKFRYKFLITIFGEIFKRCKCLYIPYVGNLVLEAVQLFDINDAFYCVMEFVIKAQCCGHFYSSQYGLENLVEYIYCILKTTYPALDNKYRQSINQFITVSLKSLTLKLIEPLEVIKRKAIVEIIVKDGKIAVIKLFLVLFKSLHKIDFNNLINSMRQIVSSYLSDDSPNSLLNEILNYELNPFLLTTHIFNTLQFPPNKEMQRRIINKEQLQGISDIVNEDEFLEIYTMLPSRLQMLVPEQIFTSSIDGLSLKTLYSKCMYHSLLLIICRRGSYIFGVFVAESFEMKKDFYGNSETFLFTIKPKARKYSHIQNSNHFIINSTPEALSFGGGTGHPSLSFDCYLNVISQTSPTFNNPPLVPRSLASRCDRVEVYSFC